MPSPDSETKDAVEPFIRRDWLRARWAQQLNIVKEGWQKQSEITGREIEGGCKQPALPLKEENDTSMVESELTEETTEGLKTSSR